MAPGAVLTPDPAGHGSGRDLRIDALRGASALAVVLHHLNAISYLQLPTVAEFWGSVTAYGYLGVPVFFVLSGYCIGRTWRKSPGPGSFFRRRFLRIYPAFFASLVLTLAIVAFWKWHNGVNDTTAIPRTPGHIAATFGLYTDPASRYPTVNWVYWSLTNEVFYYLVLGLLLLPSPGRVRAAALVSVHVTCCALQPFAAPLRGTPLFFVDHWNVFAMGLGACLWMARAPEARLFLIVSALQLAGQAMLGTIGLYEAVGAAAFVLVILPHGSWESRIRNPLVSVGRISYSLYLVHVPIGVYIFMRLAGPRISGSGWRFALTQIVGAVLCLGAAALLYHLVEKPFSSRPRPARA